MYLSYEYRSKPGASTFANIEVFNNTNAFQSFQPDLFYEFPSHVYECCYAAKQSGGTSEKIYIITLRVNRTALQDKVSLWKCLF